jgi:hypothetical protein
MPGDAKDFAEHARKLLDDYDEVEAKANTYDPILISMIRKHMPQMMAYDICGVQPMTGPTGTIFGMRSMYGLKGTLLEGQRKYPDACDEVLEREGYRD